MKSLFNTRVLIITGIILGAALSRLLPHEANITPIMAMAVFGGAYFTNKKLAYIVPLAAMFLSDIILGFHSSMIAVYFSIVLAVVISSQILKNITIGRIIVSSLLSSTIFFLLTNFAAWLVMPAMYARDISGLLLSLEYGLPFYRNAIIGDVAFCGVFFGGFALLSRFLPALVAEPVKK